MTDATTTEDFVIYSEGICMASVCSSLPQDEVESRMADRWNGIDSKWNLHEDPFRDGSSNPCPCNHQPDTHTHYLFAC